MMPQRVSNAIGILLLGSLLILLSGATGEPLNLSDEQQIAELAE